VHNGDPLLSRRVSSLLVGDANGFPTGRYALASSGAGGRRQPCNPVLESGRRRTCLQRGIVGTRSAKVAPNSS
jgi:hypothetical protein